MVGTKDGSRVIEARLLPRVWTVLLDGPGPYTVLAGGLPLPGATLTEAGEGTWHLSVELPEPQAPLALTLLAEGAESPLATQVIGTEPAGGVTGAPDVAAEIAALRAELAVMRAALRALARGSAGRSPEVGAPEGHTPDS
jgi:hypothetical protein